jgi:hypothetical protein
MSHFCRYWASVTIDAPPDAVWPWLAQIEYGIPSGRPCPAWVDSGGILRAGHFERWGRRACRRTRPLLFPSRVRLRKLEGLAEYAFRHHQAQIYRYLRRKTGDHDQAEELTQEVFADAAITLSRMDCRPASVLALLYTIAQRRFADEVRRPAIAAL